MIRKIIVTVLCFMMLFSYISFAETTKTINPYETECGFLDSLNLLPDSFSPDGVVKRGTFAKMLADVLYAEMDFSLTHTSSFTDIMYGSDYYNAVAVLEALEVVKGTGSGTFRPEDSISYQDALVMIIRAIGYLPYADAYGGYPSGYFYTAKKIGLSNGIMSESIFDMKAAAKLIYNTLFVSNVVTGYITEEGITLRVNHAANFLNTHMNIERIDAKLVHDGIISLENEGVLENGIILKELVSGENLYFETVKDYSEFFGCEVDVFYKDESGRKELVYVGLKSSVQITEINSSVITDNTTENSIEYKYGELEQGLTKKLRLNENEISVFKNGIRLTQFSASDLKPVYGKIRLIDNNGDNVYDVVMITEIASAIVANTNVGDKNIIVCKDNSVNSLDLSDDTQSAYRVYKNGVLSSLSVINENNIVSIAPAGIKIDGVQIYFLYVSDKTVNAKLTATDSSEKLLYTDSGEYRLSEIYFNTHSKIYNILETDENYVLRFDAFGEIAYIDGIKSSDLNYAFILNVIQDGQFGDIKVVLYSQYGIFSYHKISKALTVDGIRVNESKDRLIELLCTRPDGTVLKPTAYETSMYEQANLAIYPRMAIIKVNTNGEIYYIDTDTETYIDEELENTDPYVLNAGKRYLRTSRLSVNTTVGYGQIDGTFLVGNDTVVFLVPVIDRYGISSEYSLENINLYEESVSDLNGYKIVRTSDIGTYDMLDMQIFDVDKDTGVANLILLRGHTDFVGSSRDYDRAANYRIFKKMTRIYDSSKPDAELYKIYYTDQLGVESTVNVDKFGIHSLYRNIVFGGTYFDSAYNPVSVEGLQAGDVFFFSEKEGMLITVGRMINLSKINDMYASTGVPSISNAYKNSWSTTGISIPYDVRGATGFAAHVTTYSFEFGIPEKVTGNIVKMNQICAPGSTNAGTLNQYYSDPDNVTFKQTYVPFGAAESNILVIEEVKCNSHGSGDCDIRVRKGSLADIKAMSSFADNSVAKASKLFYYKSVGYPYRLIIFNLDENHDK